jgi:16S rRNA (guanine527-N7)-methyltransferase
MELIRKYFPVLSSAALQQFEKLFPLYEEWNSKINLISRNDMPYFYERHVLHSLAIAKFIRFREKSTILDIGTGGGFPGIPLAILFPQCRFTLVDSIAKKIRCVHDIVSQMNLSHVTTINDRVEHLNTTFDFAVSRAAAPLGDLHRWSAKIISKKQQNAIPNGIICLKGGDLKEELLPFRNKVEVVAVSDYFQEPFFETKKLVFLPC